MNLYLYIYIKGLSISACYLIAFAQFSRYSAKTVQVYVTGSPGQVREELTIMGVLMEGAAGHTYNILTLKMIPAMCANPVSIIII